MLAAKRIDIGSTGAARLICFPGYRILETRTITRQENGNGLLPQ
jgi:hypothetical protein